MTGQAAGSRRHTCANQVEKSTKISAGEAAEIVIARLIKPITPNPCALWMEFRLGPYHIQLPSGFAKDETVERCAHVVVGRPIRCRAAPEKAPSERHGRVASWWPRRPLTAAPLGWTRRAQRTRSVGVHPSRRRPARATRRRVVRCWRPRWSVSRRRPRWWLDPQAPVERRRSGG